MPAWVFIATPEMSYQTVYVALRSFAGADRSAFPSRERISTRARVSCSVVDRALRHFKEIGAIVVEHQYQNNKQRPSVYVFKDDCPAKFERLDFADRCPVSEDEVSAYPVSTDNNTLSPETNRTKTIELEPIKEKEKYKKEKEPSQKAEAIEEFVSKVRAIYPKRSGNMGWKYFTQRAATHFKTAKSKDDFLLAVASYKKECADLGRGPDFIKQPASFIAAHYDYITTPQEQSGIFDGISFEPGWGDTPRKQIEIDDEWPAMGASKVIKIAPWKEIGA